MSNPRRYTDPVLGLLSKVFIVYPHNPQVYQWDPPEELRRRYPDFSPAELHRMQRREEQERIRSHDQLVQWFADFLDSHMIAVAYEGLLLDCPIDSYMRWFETQMSDSDYIILIITESFRPFLNDTRPDNEHIFTGNFLHNFVYMPSKHILPVFLNRPENLDLLPDPLRASATYRVAASRETPHFNVHQPQLDRLYAVLTKQNRLQPPPQRERAVVRITSGLQGIGMARSRQSQGQISGDDRHRRMSDSLVRVRRVLTTGEMTLLAEKPGFAVRWRVMAELLGFMEAEIERIVDAGCDDEERCYQLLRRWTQKYGSSATVSLLIETCCRENQNIHVLEIAHSALCDPILS